MTACEVLHGVLPEQRDVFLDALLDAFPEMGAVHHLYNTLHGKSTGSGEIDGFLMLCTETKLITQAVQQLFAKPARCLCISNSGTVGNTLKTAKANVQEAICCRSLPGGEGELFCDDLANNGILSRLIEDGEMADYLRTVDFALVGGDMLLPDRLLNKTGTLTIAREGERLGKQVFAVVGACKRFSEIPARFQISDWYEWTPISMLNVISD
jgi:hypothetical protein